MFVGPVRVPDVTCWINPHSTDKSALYESEHLSVEEGGAHPAASHLLDGGPSRGVADAASHAGILGRDAEAL